MKKFKKALGLGLLCFFGVVSAAHADGIQNVMHNLWITLLYFPLTLALFVYALRLVCKFKGDSWERTKKGDVFAGWGLALYAGWFGIGFQIWGQQLSQIPPLTDPFFLVFLLWIGLQVFNGYGFFVLCNYYLRRGSFSKEEEEI